MMTSSSCGENRRRTQRRSGVGGFGSRRTGPPLARVSTKGSEIKPSDQFHAGEKVFDFEGGGVEGVGAVRAVVADACAEIVADGAGRGFLWIGGAHDVAPLGNGAVGFENHGENFPGAYEIGEFAEKGPLFVNGIEAARFRFREAHGLDGDNFEARLVNPRKDFTL